MDLFKESKVVLLYGCGGGYDIYAGMPLYWELEKLGKRIILTNLSFTDDLYKYAEPDLTEIRMTENIKRTRKNMNYFPENPIPVYAIRLQSPCDIKHALDRICEEYEIDTVVGIDAGHDVVIFGDEKDYNSIGSPYEDVLSVLVLSNLICKNTYVACISAPTETTMNYALFKDHLNKLQNVTMIKANPEHKEKFRQLLDSTDNKSRSIPNESLLAAMDGRYGEPHYVNPRLQVRAESDEWSISDYPPVTEDTSTYFIFPVKDLMEKSLFYCKMKERKEDYSNNLIYDTFSNLKL